MTGLFKYLENHYIGIVILIVLFIFFMILAQWTLYLLGKGKYSNNMLSSDSTKSIRYVFADLLVKIINDFRHLLALVIVSIFGLTLAVFLYVTRADSEAMSKSLQAVIAGFGGIVGTIIGYYFGESAAMKDGRVGTNSAHLNQGNDPITQELEENNQNSLGIVSVDPREKFKPDEEDE